MVCQRRRSTSSAAVKRGSRRAENDSQDARKGAHGVRKPISGERIKASVQIEGDGVHSRARRGGFEKKRRELIAAAEAEAATI